MNATVQQDPMNTPSPADAAGQSISPTIDRIAASAHEAVDRIAQRADTTFNSLRSGSEDWKARSQQSAEQLRAYVRDNPLSALGIAVAAGFVLSRLMR